MSLVAFYRRWAVRLGPFRWAAFSAALLIACLLWLAGSVPALRDGLGGAFFAVAALGLLGMIWTWGIFLVTVWFGPQVARAPHLQLLQVLGAVFLTVWFVAGTGGALWGLLGLL